MVDGCIVRLEYVRMENVTVESKTQKIKTSVSSVSQEEGRGNVARSTSFIFISTEFHQKLPIIFFPVYIFSERDENKQATFLIRFHFHIKQNDSQ